MSENYSLEEGNVKLTEIIDLGDKDKFLTNLNIEKANYQASIDKITEKLSKVQTKLDAINALE